MGGNYLQGGLKSYILFVICENAGVIFIYALEKIEMELEWKNTGRDTM